MEANAGKRLLYSFSLLALAIWALLTHDVVLGLDLQGGVTMRYELEAPELADGTSDSSSMLESTVDTLRSRIDAYGIKESSITQHGDSEIVIELPGSSSDEAQTIKSVISRVGRLEWRILAEDDVANAMTVETERTRLAELLGTDELKGKGPDDFSVTSLDLPFDELRYRWVPYSDPILAARRGVVVEDLPGALADRPLDAADYELIKIESASERNFTGADIQNADGSVDKRGNPAVEVRMRRARASEFGDWTEEHKGRLLGMLLDGRLAQPAAAIRDRLSDRFVIESGQPTGFTSAEIKNYLTIIRSGSLKMKPRLLFENTVGPSLGESSIQSGARAAIAGAVAVILFMLLYYRLHGVIAALCLLANLAMLGGALVFLGATITLPGLAGLVLTLGMAVDANILVFERLREEADRAKSFAQSVKLGFEKAFSTIVDANITTFVTAFILYKVGTGPVRGFAVVLMIGILTSVFSVLVFGRGLYQLLVEREWLAKAGMGRLLRQTPSIGFMRKARLAMQASGVLALASVVAFASAGTDKYGLDFLGGYKAQVRLARAATQGEVKAALGDAFPGAQIISVADEDGVLRERSLQFVVKVKVDASARAADGEAEVGLADRYEQPLKQALAGLVRPDFATDLTLEEDSEAQTTSVSCVLHFEGAVTPEAVQAHLGFLDDLEMGPSEDGVTVAGVLPGLAIDPQLVIQRMHSAVTAASDLPPASEPFVLSTTIGSRVGTELRDSAIRAILLSFVAIVLYIRVRFREYRYGIAAIVALAHDVCITLGVVTLAHSLGLVDVEIDLAMIAAFLTIIGYSLNDTIVLFDRVRENLPRVKKPFSEVLDLSINQTLSRTLLTSLTTLVVLGLIFYFNVGRQNVLEGFSFAMICGVLVGTYSSIFIAAPVLTLLAGHHKERAT